MLFFQKSKFIFGIIGFGLSIIFEIMLKDNHSYAITKNNRIDESHKNKRKYNSSGQEFVVQQFVRNLPEGYKHSESNAALAKLAGIDSLPKNQSFVHEYKKNEKV